MIIRRETLNEISTLKTLGFRPFAISQKLNLAFEDVQMAIAAWKL